MKRRFMQFGGLATAAVIAGLALTVPVQAQESVVETPSVAAPHTSVSTPRTPDGKPDLTGMWRGAMGGDDGEGGGGGGKSSAFVRAFVAAPHIARSTDITRSENGDGLRLVTSRRCAPNQKGTDGTGCGMQTNQNIDGELTNAYRIDSNKPLYKPEYWDKVEDLDYNTNFKDPVFTCQPLGVPRMGPPAQIVQKDNYVTFLYDGYPTNEYRVIPTDGRAHPPDAAQNITFFGDSVGHWEGDTLVVDSIGFTDITWLVTGGGYFHSYDMHVIERFRREGNRLHYDVTVDDPTVLLKPWVMNPRTLALNPDPKAFIHENDPCSQVDADRLVLRIRH